jgi:hypothetical protein
MQFTSAAQQVHEPRIDQRDDRVVVACQDERGLAQQLRLCSQFWLSFS